MNWGTGIAIFFSFFALSMISAVVATTKFPPQLVQKDYYTLDLNYQERLVKKQNTARLALPPQARFVAASKSIQLNLPPGMAAQKAFVKCYRGATMRDDFSTAFDNASTMEIPAATFAAGRWHLELDWETAEGKKYFWETALIIPGN